MRTSLYDFKLPDSLIAKQPSNQRDHSRFMVLNRQEKTIDHHHFFDILDYFSENDVLVLNNTKVINARLFGTKSTGAKIEVFLLTQESEYIWNCLIKPTKRVSINDIITINEYCYLKIINKDNDSIKVEFFIDIPIFEFLAVIIITSIITVFQFVTASCLIKVYGKALVNKKGCGSTQV